ncbi:hypothetical protein MXB_197 [Myxobolus squamalis]|nr:hypothetical protein MXB_197 [Myxobolus squamalis]
MSYLFLSTQGSKNPFQTLSRKLSNPIVCLHTTAYPGRHPDFSCFRVLWELSAFKTLPISFP